MDTRAPFAVMVAVDKSQYSEYALKYYFSHIHRPGNKLFLVHVPEGQTTTTELQKHPHLGVKEWEKLMEKETKETEELSAKFQAILDEANTPGEYKTFYGKPGEALCDAAEELQARLVVIGTRGLGSVRRTILGSVSDYLIHHARVPVVVCRQ